MLLMRQNIMLIKGLPSQYCNATLLIDLQWAVHCLRKNNTRNIYGDHILRAHDCLPKFER